MQPSAVSNRTTSTHTAACDGREHLPLSRRPEFRTFRPIINHHSNAAPTDAAVRQRSLCRDDGSAPGRLSRAVSTYATASASGARTRCTRYLPRRVASISTTSSSSSTTSSVRPESSESSAVFMGQPGITHPDRRSRALRSAIEMTWPFSTAAFRAPGRPSSACRSRNAITVLSMNVSTSSPIE
jgi:hypothetical protein